MTPQAQAPNQLVETPAARPRRTEALVVSNDDDFLIELGPLLGDGYRTRTVEPAALGSAAETSRCLAIVDAASLSDARETVGQLEKFYRGAPIIVIASDPKECNLAGARGVIAVIAREDMTGKAMIGALATAESRLRNAEPENSARLTRNDAASKTGKPGQFLRRSLLLGAALGLLILGTAWWLMHRPNVPAAPVEAVNRPTNGAGTTESALPEVPAATSPQNVLELLSAARTAFRDPKLLLPRTDGDSHGDSALDLYSQVLAREPTNEEALDGIRRLFAIGRARIQSDLSSGKLDDAARLAALFRADGIEPDAMRDIDASIAAARPKWLANRAQESIAAGDLASAEQLISQMSAAGADRGTIAELRRGIDAKKLDQQLLAMSGEVKAAIDAGMLIDPANDSARTRLQAMRTINRAHPATLAAQRELQTALLSRALDATHKDQFDVAQRYLAAAGDLGATTEVADAKRQLQSEMDLVAERSAAAAEAKAKQAANAAAAAHSAQSSSAAAGSDTPSYIRAKPTGPVNAVYPESAIASRAEGSVTIEFTLSADGTASDATVVEAKPPGIFDSAAKRAVLSGRYDVSALTDRKPARARIRITFKPS